MELKKKITFSFLWNILLMGVSFINNILITRILLPEARGQYVFFTSNATLLNAIISIGLFTSVVYFGSSQKVSVNKMFFSLGLLYFLMVLSVALVIHFGYTFLEIDHIASSKSLLYLLLVNACITIFISLLSSILLSKQKVNDFNIVQLISPFIMAVIFAILQFSIKTYTSEFLITWYTGSLVFSLLVAFYFVFLKNKFVDFRISFLSLVEFKLIFFFGLFSFACDIIQFLNYRIDYWFIKFYASDEILGIYSLSSTLSQLIWVLPSAISTILFPWVASLEKGENDRVKEILIISKITFLICMLGAVLGVFLLTFFVPLVFSTKYIDVTYYYSILIIGTIPYCYSKLYASVIAGMAKVSINFRSSLVGFVITILLNFVLTRNYGAVGASITSVLSYLASTLVILFFIRKEWKVSILDIIWVNKNDLVFIKTKVTKIFS